MSSPASSPDDDSSKTLPRLKVPFVSESAKTTPYLRAQVSESAKTTPFLRAQVSESAKTTPFLRAARIPSAEGRLTDERVREIHGRLVELSGRPISMEKLAQSLRETEARLRAVHGDRPIEFHVVTANGRPLIKPIVR